MLLSLKKIQRHKEKNMTSKKVRYILSRKSSLYKTMLYTQNAGHNMHNIAILQCIIYQPTFHWKKQLFAKLLQPDMMKSQRQGAHLVHLPEILLFNDRFYIQTQSVLPSLTWSIDSSFILSVLFSSYSAVEVCQGECCSNKKWLEMTVGFVGVVQTVE